MLDSNETKISQLEKELDELEQARKKDNEIIEQLRDKLEQSEETSKDLLRQFEGLNVRYNAVKKENEDIGIVERKLRECSKELQDHKTSAEKDYKKLMELSEALIIYHVVAGSICEMVTPRLIDSLAEVNRIGKIRTDHKQLIDYAKIITDKSNDKDEDDYFDD
jgi:chromosome segregation ATPase